MIDHDTLTLAETGKDDLAAFFQFQLDAEANFMAAFTPKDPTDRAAYMDKYSRLLSDPAIHMRTIRVKGEIVGSISKFEIEGQAEITYWIDKKYWGRGIASAALQKFLTLERARPICGRVAFDNLGSQQVLEKAGFRKTGTDRGFANARQQEIEEFIYRLSS